MQKQAAARSMEVPVAGAWYGEAWHARQDLPERQDQVWRDMLEARQGRHVLARLACLQSPRLRRAFRCRNRVAARSRHRRPPPESSRLCCRGVPRSTKERGPPVTMHAADTALVREGLYGRPLQPGPGIVSRTVVGLLGLWPSQRGQAVVVAHELSDGEVLPFDSLRAIHTPGPAPGTSPCCCRARAACCSWATRPHTCAAARVPGQPRRRRRGRGPAQPGESWRPWSSRRPASRTASADPPRGERRLP